MFELPTSFIQALTAMGCILCLLSGIAVVWTNPQRMTNRAFAVATSLHALWLACVYAAMKAGEILKSSGQADLAFWLRANSAVSAFFPWAYWLIICAILSNDNGRLALRRSSPWLAFGIIFFPVCFLDAFVQTAPLLTGYHRGIPYYIYTSCAIIAHIIGFVKSAGLIKTQSGIRRIEIQFVATTMGAAVACAFLLNLLGNAVNIRALNRSSLFLLPISNLLAACALGYHRIFDARLIYLSLCQLFGTILLLSIGITATSLILPSAMPLETRLLISSLVAGIVALLFEHKLRAILQPREDALLGQDRRNVMKAAQSETDVNKLRVIFEQLLSGLCGVDRVELHPSAETRSSSAPSTMISTFDIVHSGWRETGWISPESLERLRPSRASYEIRQFFTDNSVALVVAVPCMSTSPSLVATFGLKRNRWPFTYPEIQRTTKVVEMMDSVLTHANVVSQAVLKARMEHLALMSRGLAHDLKNLITPVSSFLIHAERKLSLDEVESEVHAAAKRSVRIMTEYIQQSLSFAASSEPRMERAAIGSILQTVQEVTAARAERRRVSIKPSITSALEVFADSVLLQRMLTNLVCNAIDASRPNSIVSIIVTGEINNLLRIRVVDEGSGIAPEHLNRVFEPYFTTKEYGDDLRGFGLGLTIAQQIAHIHNGTIKIESEPNHGTTATIDLPLGASASLPVATTDSPPAVSQNLQVV